MTTFTLFTHKDFPTTRAALVEHKVWFSAEDVLLACGFKSNTLRYMLSTIDSDNKTVLTIKGNTNHAYFDIRNSVPCSVINRKGCDAFITTALERDPFFRKCDIDAYALWLDDIEMQLTNKQEEITMETKPVSTMQMYNNAEFGNVRILMENDKPLLCATDVAKALGYTNARKAILDHCKGVTKRYTLTNGGSQELSYIPEGDVYRLIVRSKLPSAEKFERWVFDEVLPTIRKTGAYMTPQTAQKVQENPEYINTLITAMTQMSSRMELLLDRYEEAKPKAEYFDTVLHDDELFPVTAIAKEFGLTPQALNNLLHEQHIQYRCGGRWELYAEYADKGYVKKYTYCNGRNGAYIPPRTDTRWTQLGRKWLREKLSAVGIKPVTA